MYRLLRLFFVLFAVLPAWIPLQAAAVVIYPSEDSYTDSNQPLVNNGTATVLSAVNWPPMLQNSFLKFNTWEIPMGTITSAVLYLYSGYSMGNPMLSFQACSSDWSETALNYSNAPGVMGASYGLGISDSVTGYYSVPVTNIVTGWKTGPNYGLRISMTTSMQAVFYSRESGSTQSPYLLITYNPPAGTHTVSPTISQTWTNSPVVSATVTRTQTQTHTITPTLTITPTSSIITIPEAVDNLALVFTDSGNAFWAGQSLNAYSGGDSARSGAIGHSQSSSMQTTVTGPGTLSFYWSVSSESGFDYLRLYVDGIQVNSIAGIISWTYYSYNLGAGTHTLRWTYSKDGSVVNGSDCGWVDQIQFMYLTPTITRTVTPTRTISPTWSISRTHTVSPTFSATRTITQTRTVSPTITVTFTPAPTLGIPEAVDNYTLSFINGGTSSWYGQVMNSYNGGDSARSGPVGHYQNTYMETTAVGPGPLTFYWSVSSESGYDYLTFYINGIYQTQISGYVGWTLRSYTLSPGVNTLRWTYSKDGSVVSGSDCGWVDMIQFANVTPTISPTVTPTLTQAPTISIPEAVDNYSLSFTNGGNAYWYGQVVNSFFGGDSARSGAIGNSQSSYMETSCAGPGPFSFYWSVSSESGYDYLRFYINGVQQNQISGTINWTLQSYTLPAGNNMLRWTYSKDGSVSTGSDCGWVDLITGGGTPTFTPTFTITITGTPPTLTVTPTQTIYVTPLILPGTGTAWTLAANPAAFTGRYGHTSVVFNNKIWVIGGEAAGFYNDVWNSSDGVSWTCAANSAGFTQRAGHTSVVFNNKIWVIGGGTWGGGTSDVWSSSDGIIWTQVTASAGFLGRQWHTSVVFNNKMWVIGGHGTGGPLSDVWSSTDGITWVLETAFPGFVARGFHSSEVHNGRIWVVNGTDSSGISSYHDVWSSANGVTWVQETAAAAYSARYGNTLLSYGGKLWMMGGYDAVTNSFRNDVWSSPDGAAWTLETAAANFSQRAAQTSVVFSSRMWVISGIDSTYGYPADVWYSPPAAVLSQTVTPGQPPTFTRTQTITPVNTMTFTAVVTIEIPTASKTCTLTPTSTPTATETSTPGLFEINDVLTYPNPFNPNTTDLFGFKYDVTRDVRQITVKIYTVSFKLIRNIVIATDACGGARKDNVSGRYFLGLASGIYYYQIEAEDMSGNRKKSRILTLIIIN